MSYLFSNLKRLLLQKQVPFMKVGRKPQSKKDVIDKRPKSESARDKEFEALLRGSRKFGKKRGITQRKIQQATQQVRKDWEQSFRKMHQNKDDGLINAVLAK